MNLMHIQEHLQRLISTKNYPCIAAIQALHKNEIITNAYDNFGSGLSAPLLLQNLKAFKQRQQAGEESYLTYFAVFPNDTCTDEDDFEKRLWAELSAVCNEPNAGPWDPEFSDNPTDKNFCFSIDGSAFFVVGMHPQSSRTSRQFPYPALAFNLYSQFTDLMQKNTYHPMVALNRQRDLKFQGSINPMAEQYNEEWEAIQFSGKKNPPSWQCPFFREMKNLVTSAWK